MVNRVVIIYGCLLVLGGCMYKEESMPEIMSQPEPKIVQPKIVKPAPPPKIEGISKDIPSGWFPPSRLEKDWSAIIIHHSATTNGNAAIFDKWHRQGNYWEGVGYDFVIGNGTDSDDGRVEVTFRWRQQVTGAHCRTP